jgi:hypothetical protein
MSHVEVQGSSDLRQYHVTKPRQSLKRLYPPRVPTAGPLVIGLSRPRPDQMSSTATLPSVDGVTKLIDRTGTEVRLPNRQAIGSQPLAACRDLTT